MATAVRTLNTQIAIAIAAVLTSLDQHTQTKAGQDYELSLADGTGANQANQVYERVNDVTLTAGTSITLDLNGTLINSQGETVNFTSIKLLVIINNSTDSSCTLTVGAAAANKWETWTTVTGSTLLVRAQGGIAILGAPDATGFAVTPATAEQLKILNNGSATATFSLLIIGNKS